MSNALVIVESPAKAKTISKLLGDGFDVHASIGHIADLPSKGLSVDVENSFKPNYELTERGIKVVKDLKALLKVSKILYIATDEDREGEAIAAHLLEYLKPKIEVRRMVFHEITKGAITQALEHTREIDYKLVDAAEARRILDRLYGYSVSPILWRKVNRGLSAGRVQSPSIRLIVEREQERIAHVSANYFSLEATSSTTPVFTASLQSIDGQRIAVGKDFDQGGIAKQGVVVIDQSTADHLVNLLEGKDLQVRSVEDRPYRKSPQAPFITSTLQQECGNKLKMTAAEVMRLAQGLYEGGFITYMRTDNVLLSDEALDAIRNEIAKTFGADFVSIEPRTYKSKVKNAQEAHEPIRPTLPLRSPEEVAGELHLRELTLYKIIWQRTLGSQMTDAIGTTVTVKLARPTNADQQPDCEFTTSGTTIIFPGYRQVYQEVDDDNDGQESEALLPELKVGELVQIETYLANGHTTSPPARYTEPSLVKKLEELGIGRPSTYAAIVSTILNRGYVWKKGQAIVPSWTAFAVVKLLKNHFGDLVDYDYTELIERDLDEIANGLRDKTTWLGEFYFGNGNEMHGLKPLVDHNITNIDAAELNAFPVGMHPTSGDEIILRPGKFGPYVKCGENTASVPDTMTPDELNVAIAVELLAAPKYDMPIGELEGLPIFKKTGRYGPYVQWGEIENPPPDMKKPKMVSLFKSMSIDNITIVEALQLLCLPRTVGANPIDGELITAQNGRYGPYISKGKDTRPLESEEQIFSITIDQALVKLAEPKQFGRRGPAKPPLKDFGVDPTNNRLVVAKDGKFGTYITDGETNASLTRGDRLEFVTPERAFELLAIRREYVESGQGGKKTKKAATAKKKPAKKAAAKKKKTKPAD